MGSCVSTSKGRHKSWKFCVRSRKCCGKISASVPDARTVQISDAGSVFAQSESVHLQTSVTNRKKSGFSNLAFHLSQLQWHHTRMNAGNVTCAEETWFDSVSTLESDCCDDSNSVNGDLFPAVARETGSQTLQYEDSSLIVDDLLKFKELSHSSAVTLSVEERLKRVGKAVKLLSEDDLQEPNRFKIICLEVCGITSGEVDKEELRMHYVENVAETKKSGEFCCSSEGSKVDILKTQEHAHECTLKSGMPSFCAPSHNLSANSSDKIQSFYSARTGCQKRKLVVIQIDGEEATEVCASTRYSYRLGAGILSLCSPEEKRTQRCSSILEPSSFKLPEEDYFRDKKKSPAPDYSPYIPISIDMILCWQAMNHIAQNIELLPVEACEKVPSVPTIDTQIPTYPAPVSLGGSDGEGVGLVLYFEVSENLDEKIAPQFHDSIQRLVNGEIQKVKGFPCVPYRGRLKIVTGLVKPVDMHLSAAESKLVCAYNEKLIHSCLQHNFYMVGGSNYVEVNKDIHLFSYISRKVFEAFRECVKQGTLHQSLTIQIQKQEELPENVV